jgi:hypothetical protein
MYEYVRVCTSMYQYNQGLQIFMVCIYHLVIFGSKIQCAVLRTWRHISALINNKSKLKADKIYTQNQLEMYMLGYTQYMTVYSIYVDVLSYPNSFS